MAYLDGLPIATSVSLADIIEIGQGGTPGVPGTATTRQVALSLLLAGAGPFLPLIGGNVTGPLLVGTGTPAGGAYQFQSAISIDPSLGSADFRYNIFNTTLSYSGNSSRVWENLNSFITVNGPGHANGEINGVHSFLQVNAGATVTQYEGFEFSLTNNGAITGSGVYGFLAQPVNGVAGTASSIIGLKFQFTNNNTTPGAVTQYFAIDNEEKTGTAPTNYGFIRQADPAGAIVTVGQVGIGSLSIPGAGTSLQVVGVDNTAGTFSIAAKSADGTNTFFVDNSGVAHFKVGTWNAAGGIAAAGVSPVSTNLVLGTGVALATNATTGMILIPTCAGAPTGNVGAGGQAALIFDTTDGKIYAGVSGTWKSVALT
jgi:hypothetical protein